LDRQSPLGDVDPMDQSRKMQYVCVWGGLGWGSWVTEGPATN
jgi:hypothetical protein